MNWAFRVTTPWVTAPGFWPAAFLNEGGFGDVPFSGQSMLNGNRNLRGYSNGRYRADQLLTVEAEYRWMFHKRWGAVAFAGLGWVADEVPRCPWATPCPLRGSDFAGA